MDIIKATRDLGKIMQSDERFISYAKAKLDMEKDENLQNKIGEFNIARMNIERLLEAEKKDDDAVKQANISLRNVYDDIMKQEVMVRYNQSKAQVDKMLSDIMGIIRMCAEGEDPDTCEINDSCTGNCSTCGGCH